MLMLVPSMVSRHAARASGPLAARFSGPPMLFLGLNEVITARRLRDVAEETCLAGIAVAGINDWCPSRSRRSTMARQSQAVSPLEGGPESGRMATASLAFTGRRGALKFTMAALARTKQKRLTSPSHRRRVAM